MQIVDQITVLILNYLNAMHLHGRYTLVTVLSFSTITHILRRKRHKKFLIYVYSLNRMRAQLQVAEDTKGQTN